MDGSKDTTGVNSMSNQSGNGNAAELLFPSLAHSPERTTNHISAILSPIVFHGLLSYIKFSARIILGHYHLN